MHKNAEKFKKRIQPKTNLKPVIQLKRKIVDGNVFVQILLHDRLLSSFRRLRTWNELIYSPARKREQADYTIESVVICTRYTALK